MSRRLVQRWSAPDIASEILVVRPATDAQFVATGATDGTVRIYHPRTGALLYSLPSAGGDAALPVTAIRWRPGAAKTKNVMLVATADGVIRHCHATSQRVLARMAAPDQIYALDYRVDGEMFAAAGKDKTIRFFDDTTGQATSVCRSGGYDIAGHSNRVFSVKWDTRDVNRVVSGGWDNTVLFWDIRTSTPVASLFGPHICGDAIDIYDNLMVTGSWRPDNALQLWDVRFLKANAPAVNVPWYGAAAGSGKSAALATRAAARGAPTLLYAAAFSPSGAFIAAGGSGSNEAKVFDTLGALRASTEYAGAMDEDSKPAVQPPTYATPVCTGTVAGMAHSVYSLAFDTEESLMVAGGDFLYTFDLVAAATSLGSSHSLGGGASVVDTGLEEEFGRVEVSRTKSSKLSAAEEAALTAAYGGEEGDEDEDDDRSPAARAAGSGAPAPAASGASRFGVVMSALDSAASRAGASSSFRSVK